MGPPAGRDRPPRRLRPPARAPRPPSRERGPSPARPAAPSVPGAAARASGLAPVNAGTCAPAGDRSGPEGAGGGAGAPRLGHAGRGGVWGRRARQSPPAAALGCGRSRRSARPVAHLPFCWVVQRCGGRPVARRPPRCGERGRGRRRPGRPGPWAGSGPGRRAGSGCGARGAPRGSHPGPPLPPPGHLRSAAAARSVGPRGARAPGLSRSLPGLETPELFFLKELEGVGTGENSQTHIGQPRFHHALGTTNRGKCQRPSCALLLFARFGIFISPLTPRSGVCVTWMRGAAPPGPDACEPRFSAPLCSGGSAQPSSGF